VQRGNGRHYLTLATFHKTFLALLKGLFVQILVLAGLGGVLQLDRISLDGRKVHADAAKSKAASYKRLLEVEKQLAQSPSLPDALPVHDGTG